HPHYSSLLIIGLGLGIFFYSLLTLVIAILAFPLMIWSVIDEEKYLLKEYGKEYEDYMKEVRWRLIPGIF
ncbi:MAG TPA: isoprenylcysteine carboxylmethyltransferase family protein, partial [Thermoplasmatales archaeon]|nr:isoprenylcysteine carboxylmethyltransferase family protein [Thermoplasmatales archaeon]